MRTIVNQEPGAKPFHAVYEFKTACHKADFDDFCEAKEWCCVRLDNAGEKFERFARVAVYRANVPVWESPAPKPEKKIDPLAGFDLPTVR